jgi:hypothetical protein
MIAPVRAGRALSTGIAAIQQVHPAIRWLGADQAGDLAMNFGDAVGQGAGRDLDQLQCPFLWITISGSVFARWSVQKPNH